MLTHTWEEVTALLRSRSHSSEPGVLTGKAAPQKGAAARHDYQAQRNRFRSSNILDNTLTSSQRATLVVIDGSRCQSPIDPCPRSSLLGRTEISGLTSGRLVDELLVPLSELGWCRESGRCLCACLSDERKGPSDSE